MTERFPGLTAPPTPVVRAGYAYLDRLVAPGVLARYDAMRAICRLRGRPRWCGGNARWRNLG